MKINKLAFCCMIGILLGFILPIFLKTDRYTTLMIGMVGGLIVGWLVDRIDTNKSSSQTQAQVNMPDPGKNRPRAQPSRQKG